MAFYLCDDPKRDIPGGVVANIYAHEKPRFFAIMMTLNEDTPVSKINYSGTTVTFRHFIPGENELAHYLLMVSDNIDGAKYAELAEKLKQAVEWFVSIVADEAEVEKIEHMFLDPINENLKPAQLIKFGKTGEHLLNFGMGAKGFKSEEDALQFMHKELGISQDRLFFERMVNLIA